MSRLLKSVCMPPYPSQTHIFHNKYTSLIAVMPRNSYKHTTHVALVQNNLNQINLLPSAQSASPNQVQSATEPSSPYEWWSWWAGPLCQWWTAITDLSGMFCKPKNGPHTSLVRLPLQFTSSSLPLQVWYCSLGYRPHFPARWCNNCPREEHPRDQLSNETLVQVTVVQENHCTRHKLDKLKASYIIFSFYNQL